MKNSVKFTLGMLGLVGLLLTMSCENESLDELDEKDKVFEENHMQEKITHEDLSGDKKNYLEVNYLGVNQQKNEELEPLCEITNFDLTLVLDQSGSMLSSVSGKTRMDAAKNGAKLLTDGLNSSAQAALVSYESAATRRSDLTEMDQSGRDALKSAIDALVPNGVTNIQGGIIFAAEELAGDENLFDFVSTNPSGKNRSSAEKVMILLSDGEANTYYHESGYIASGIIASQKAKEAAEVARTAGIRIITIAVGGADEVLMRNLASSEDDFYTTNDEGLENLFQEIAVEICPTQVEIDIKPWSDPNAINRKQNGGIPVAVWGTNEFDVTTIDPETVRFGSLDAISSDEGTNLTHYGGHFEDVDGDGKMDFVGHFATQETGFSSDDEQGWLIGKTKDGESFAGRDAVWIIK